MKPENKQLEKRSDNDYWFGWCRTVAVVLRDPEKAIKKEILMAQERGKQVLIKAVSKP